MSRPNRMLAQRLHRLHRSHYPPSLPWACRLSGMSRWRMLPHHRFPLSHRQPHKPRRSAHRYCHFISLQSPVIPLRHLHSHRRQNLHLHPRPRRNRDQLVQLLRHLSWVQRCHQPQLCGAPHRLLSGRHLRRKAMVRKWTGIRLGMMRSRRWKKTRT